MPRRSKRKTLAFSLLMLALSAAVTLAAGEALVRIRQGALLDFSNVLERHLQSLSTRNRTQYHPRLGHIPRPGKWFPEPGVAATVDERGCRVHGKAPEGRTVLAVGDSFAWGDEVGDEDTWPAALQEILGRPVVNAGGFGYGFDQAVLRAQELVPEVSPQWIVAGLIPSDVPRCAFSLREAWKPYFVVEGGELSLKNVPVPKGPRGRPGRWFTRALGHSRLADFLFRRLSPRWWFEKNLRETTGEDPARVAGLLVGRLARAARENGCRLLLVVQAERPRPSALDRLAFPVVERAGELNVPCLYLPETLFDLGKQFPSLQKRLWNRNHMSAEGNRWVAERIAEALRALEGRGPYPEELLHRGEARP